MFLGEREEDLGCGWQHISSFIPLKKSFPLFIYIFLLLFYFFSFKQYVFRFYYVYRIIRLLFYSCSLCSYFISFYLYVLFTFQTAFRVGMWQQILKLVCLCFILVSLLVLIFILHVIYLYFIVNLCLIHYLFKYVCIIIS